MSLNSALSQITSAYRQGGLQGGLGAAGTGRSNNALGGQGFQNQSLFQNSFVGLQNNQTGFSQNQGYQGFTRPAQPAQPPVMQLLLQMLVQMMGLMMGMLNGQGQNGQLPVTPPGGCVPPQPPAAPTEAGTLDRISESFDTIDANHDGALSNQELGAARESLGSSHAVNLEKLLANNSQFKFAHIADGAAAWEGMTREDVSTISNGLNNGLSFTDVVNQSKNWGGGQVGTVNLKLPQAINCIC